MGSFPIAGTLDQLTVDALLMDANGTMTCGAMIVSTSGPPPVTDNIHSIAIAVGAFFPAIQISNTNVIDNFTGTYSIRFTPTDGVSQIFMFGSSANLNTGATRFFQPDLNGASKVAQVAEATAELVWALGPQTMTRIEARLSGSSAPGNYAFTVIKNTVATGLTITLTASAGPAGFSVNVGMVNGDTISLRSVPAAGPTGRVGNWGISFEAPAMTPAKASSAIAAALLSDKLI